MSSRLTLKLHSAYLDRDRLEISALKSLLPASEIQIPLQRGLDTHHRRQIAARGLLRRWLSAELPELGLRPEQWVILRGVGQKPTIADHPSVQFNVSHSDGAALFALAPPGVRIGVDLERTRETSPESRSQLDGWIRRIGSLTEQKVWENIPRDDRPRAFSRLWVAKEACLKALGTGFQMAPQSLTVPFQNGDSPWVETLEGRVHVSHLEVGSRYVGAVAIILPLGELEILASGELSIQAEEVPVHFIHAPHFAQKLSGV